MKLNILHEESTSSINLFNTDAHTLKQVFDAMAGQGFYDYSINDDGYYSIGGFYKWVEQLMDDYGEEGMDEEDMRFTNFTVYGNGGWHRYFVNVRGDVDYSLHHGRGDADKAASFGFKVR